MLSEDSSLLSNIKIIGISGGRGAWKTALANAFLQHYEGDI